MQGPGMASGRPQFSLGGFPIRVRPGFAVFVAMILLVYRGPRGVWLAIALTLLTVAHELGHAFAARRCGAEAQIALDFVAGYTSFTPTRPLGNRERALIAVAGPVAEIVPGLVVLATLGANPLSYESVRLSPIREAFWWAGPVLGLANLVPVIPLDGGAVLAAGLDEAAPGRGRDLALWFSVALTVGLSIVAVTVPSAQPLLLFAAFLLTFQVIQFVGDRRRARRPHRATHLVVRAMLDEGRPIDAAREAARRFEVLRDPELAVLVARGAVRAGEPQTALAWLQAAGHAAEDPAEVLADLDLEPDFAELRDSPAGQRLRAALRGY